jgi:hypothetical protein
MPERDGPGRPEANIDWKQVDQMLMSGANGVQIAAKLCIHYDTLYRSCQRDNKVVFTVYAQSKKEAGNSLIYNKIYHKAIQDGNMQALLHLAKHRLGEWDKVPVTEELSPKQDTIDKDHENMLLKAQLNVYQEKERLAQLNDNKPETGSELCGGYTPL